MTMPIETERLRIRWLRVEDAPVLHETVFADPEVMRLLPPKFASDSVERTTRRVNRWVDHLHRHGFTWCAVEERDSSQFLGMTGLYTVTGMGEDIEVACLLGRPAWGRGIATETVGALLAYAFDELGAERIVAFPRPENPSRRVLDKLGVREIGPVTYMDDQVLLYAIERDDYRGARSRRDTEDAGRGS